MQPQRFFMLGINPDMSSYVVRVTCQVSGLLNIWWLNNHKTHAAIPDTFDSLVAEIHKSFLLPNMRVDAIMDMLLLTHGFWTCVVYKVHTTV
jgi:hypothetical protein